MKVGIVVITFNISTRVFILQMEAIKKFCQDDFVIEVVDNSNDEAMAEAIRHHAGVQEVNYTKVVSATQDPSLSHSFAANMAYKKFHPFYDALLFLDHDCIPVKPFCVKEMLDGGLIAGMLSGHALSYFWPGLFLISSQVDPSLVDFSPNPKLRYDTGGGLSILKDTYGDEKCRYVDEVGHQNIHQLNHKEYYFYMMMYKGTFMHFINSSNWRGLENDEARVSSLIAIATEKISHYDLLQYKPD